jgi:hypothetical protein
VGVKKIKARDLKPAPYNPRTIEPEVLEEMGRSMREFGDLSGIVFNRTTQRLVGGHQRMKHIPEDAEVVIEQRVQNSPVGTVAVGHVVLDGEQWRYREVKWPEEKEKAANLAANKFSGEWDLDLLGVVLDDLEGFDFPIGFSDAEIRELRFDPDSITPASPDDQGDLGAIGTKHTCPECGHEFTA